MKKILINISILVMVTMISCDKYQQYDITGPEPVAKVGIKETNGATVTMSNESENAVSYLWDFGDGSQSTEKEPTYEFELPGVWKIRFTAFSKNYAKASIDSMVVTIKGGTGEASNFVGNYEGLIQADGGSKLSFTTTTELVPGENAITFGNLLKANRLLYTSWGYSTTDGTDDRAKIVLKDSGIIEIPLQYMYHIDGFGYIDDVYIMGRGKYNANTGALSLEYVEMFLADGLNWDGELITERVVIARKK